MDEIASIRIRYLAWPRGEEGESGGSDVDLSNVAQAQPSPAGDRRRVALLHRAQPAIEVGGRNTSVPHLSGGEDGRHQCLKTEPCEPGYPDEGDTRKLGQRYGQARSQLLPQYGGFVDHVPFIGREHERPPLLGDE